MRDKLIEMLFGTALHRSYEYSDGDFRKDAEKTVDHLIAHGVTLAEDNNVPTKEAEPVKHGRWDGPYKVDAEHVGYKCSICAEYGVPCWHYCPICGVKMDLEDTK